MRNLEVRFVYHVVAEEEDVDIDGTRAPARAGAPPLEVALHGLDVAQQRSWREVGRSATGRVVKERLALGPDRVGLVEGGNGLDAHLGRQASQRLGEIALTVAQIGA